MLRLLFLTLCLSFSPLYAQTVDSLPLSLPDSVSTSLQQTSTSTIDSSFRFKWQQTIIPAVLIATGAIFVGNDWIIYQNHEIHDEMHENIDHQLTIDDYAQYAPMAAVYGLSLLGVKAKHNYLDRTILLGMAYAMMGVSVNVLKNSVDEWRPDSSSNNSFPSGHTATSFLGAEMLWQEYHATSPWIGIAGYVEAAGIGFFRMYNSRHWLTDVIEGAGIGMLCTKAAYWLYPPVSHLLHLKRNLAFVPYYNSQSAGLYCHYTF